MQLSEQDISQAAEWLAPHIQRTPVLDWHTPALASRFDGRVVVKLELLQHTGTFKARGALLNLKALDDEAKARGVTAVSAGNHAIAVGFAASRAGSHAKVVMPRSANPYRVALCQQYGAEVVLVDDVFEAFETVEAIRQQEGRAFIHPYDTRPTLLGTATVGRELLEQAGEFDAVVVPVGGGGLIAGIAAAVKQARPTCRIYGIEPVGAPLLHRSLQAGEPISLGVVNTIADSLGAPKAAPGSFDLCRQYVDEVVLVEDDALRDGMVFALSEMKLALEPAAAAGLAGLFGPLRERLAGQRVALICCGSNIDHQSYLNLLKAC